MKNVEMNAQIEAKLNSSVRGRKSIELLQDTVYMSVYRQELFYIVIDYLQILEL